VVAELPVFVVLMAVIKSEVKMNCIIVERTSVRYVSARIAD